MTVSWIPLLLLPLCGCDLDVASTVTEVPDDSGDPSTDDPSVDDTADTAGGGEDTDTNVDPFDRDDDGDGWSENDGDCDDGDPAINPDQDDSCDGEDNDCDGDYEEDARGDDIYEPNDEQGEWFYVGSLADSQNFSVTGYLHNEDDVDQFSFYTDDPWYETFGFDVSVSNIPSDANYQLHLGRVADDGSLEDSESVYGSGSLSLHEDGTTFVDDGGTYGVVIEVIGGADCSQAYLLTISKG